MGVKRIVDTDFWRDEKVIDFYSPEDKYFWLYLLTNPQSKQLGIYKLPKKIIAFETGYSVETVKILIDRFQNKYNAIIYSEETQEIAILNYLKYSIIKGGKPVIDCIMQDIKQVRDIALLKEVYKQTLYFTDDRDTFKQIQELLSIYKDNDNDNDNDNDSNVPRIEERIEEMPEFKQKTKKKKSPSMQHKYGEYKNVLLSDEQLEKLKKEFPVDWDKRIENVSEYCASKGKTYTNYLATIKSWAKKEKQEPEQQQIKKPTNKFHDFIQHDKRTEQELEELARKKREKMIRGNKIE